MEGCRERASRQEENAVVTLAVPCRNSTNRTRKNNRTITPAWVVVRTLAVPHERRDTRQEANVVRGGSETTVVVSSSNAVLNLMDHNTPKVHS